MKKLIYLFFAFYSLVISAQNSSSEEVKQTIKTFFNAFHEQDSIVLQNSAYDSMVLQTIIEAKDSLPILKTEDYSKFINAIISIPASLKFEERVLDYIVQVDGAMAHVWAPYEFWLDGKFHHCGVNSFQLLKQKNMWKIIYLIDTRRVEDCEPSTH